MLKKKNALGLECPALVATGGREACGHGGDERSLLRRDGDGFGLADRGTRGLRARRGVSGGDGHVAAIEPEG